jgi:hypothetical protein
MKRHKPTDDEILEVLSTSVSLRSNLQILLRNTSFQSSAANTFETPINALAEQLELTRYSLQPESETDDHGNTLQNVRYYSDDSEQPSTPTFINCRLKNVDFVQCKFYETEFCNLTLSNVAFLYVDLHNVGISNLNLESYVWKTTIVRNAVLVHKPTQKLQNTRAITLEPYLPLSSDHEEGKLLIEIRRLAPFAPKAANSVRRYEDCFEASIQVLQTPRRDLLVRLVDHMDIVSQIIQNCVSRHNPFFEKYVQSANGSTNFHAQRLTSAGTHSLT